MVLLPVSGPRAKRGRSEAAELGRYAGLGFSFAAAVALFGAVGWWLDKTLATGPWLLVSGLLLGCGLAFYSLLRAVPRGTGATKKTSSDR